MRIVSMTMASTKGKATIEQTGANIKVTVLAPDGEHTHHVAPGCHDDLWSMAECLQETLDGCVGTNSMVHDYYRELERFTD